MSLQSQPETKKNIDSDSAVWCPPWSRIPQSDATPRILTPRDDGHCRVWLRGMMHIAEFFENFSLLDSALWGIQRWDVHCCVVHTMESDSMLWWTRGVWLNVVMNTWSLTQCCDEHVESDSMLLWTRGVWLNVVMNMWSLTQRCGMHTAKTKKNVKKNFNLCVYPNTTLLWQISEYRITSRNVLYIF